VNDFGLKKEEGVDYLLFNPKIENRKSKIASLRWCDHLGRRWSELAWRGWQ
jgi:hypothetical protein